MVRLLSNFIQRWSTWSYIQKMSMTRLTPKLHSLTTLIFEMHWVFNGLYLLNRACHDQSLYETHIVSHIWYFSWPHYLWPWMTFKGQIKYNWVFNGLYLLNGACYDQILHETHRGSQIHMWPHVPMPLLRPRLYYGHKWSVPRVAVIEAFYCTCIWSFSWPHKLWTGWPWMTFKCQIRNYGSDFEQYLNKFHFW